MCVAVSLLFCLTEFSQTTEAWLTLMQVQPGSMQASASSEWTLSRRRMRLYRCSMTMVQQGSNSEAYSLGFSDFHSRYFRQDNFILLLMHINCKISDISFLSHVCMFMLWSVYVKEWGGGAGEGGVSKCYSTQEGQRTTQGLVVTSHLFETGSFVCYCIHLQEFSCLHLPPGNRNTLMADAGCCIQFSWTLGIRAQVLRSVPLKSVVHAFNPSPREE